MTDTSEYMTWLYKHCGIGDDAEGYFALSIEARNLAFAAWQAARATPADHSKLMVWSGSMPESNGKTNYTAILHRGDLSKGFTIDRSEYPDRVRYEADRVRWLIGEIDKEPWILAYDADKHSGYVAPQPPQNAADHIEAQSVRGEVIEECAALCDLARKKIRSGQGQIAADVCAQQIRALARMPAPPQKPDAQSVRDAWQPIETAPRDGRNILIRFGRDGVSQAMYVPGVPHPWKFIDTNDGVTWLINSARDAEYGPSHWMPMPAPPQKPVSDEVKP